MKIRALLTSGIAATMLTPALAMAQATGSTATAGPRSFAQWDKIEITVETKYGNNLAILHGSPGLDTTHPDAAGGRVDVARRLKTTKVAEPGKRKAGVMVKDVDELVNKLKNEAKVIQ